MTTMFDTVVARTVFSDDICEGKKSTNYLILATGVLIPHSLEDASLQETSAKKVQVAKPKPKFVRNDIRVKVGDSTLDITPTVTKDNINYIKVDRLLYLMRKAHDVKTIKMGDNLLIEYNNSAYKVSIEHIEGDSYVKLSDGNMRMLGIEMKGSKLVFLKQQ